MAARKFVGMVDYPKHGESISPDHFGVHESDQQVLGDGDVLLETLVLSADPYMRGCMTGVDDYVLPQFGLGEPVRSMGIARVIESNDPQHSPGDIVTGIMDWADVAAWSGRDYLVGEGKLKTLPAGIERLSDGLGVLGLTGTTAFFGMLAVARPRPGETVLISGAGGGVGTVAGQIAKIQGATVYGLSSAPEKRAALTDQLGFDGALDYTAPDFAEQLAATIPGGPDVYFDNVGGEVSQAVMWSMTRGARIIECGQIATLESSDESLMMNITPIHMHGLKFEAFATPHFFEFMPAAIAQLSHWLDNGKLVALETRYEGLEAAPEAMAGLYRGDNLGKAIISVAED